MAKKLRLGFVLDPPEKIKCLEDTSFYIMKEAYERGHEIFYLDSRHIYAQGRDVLARAGKVSVDFQDGFKEIEVLERLDLASLDLLFIRKDPPFDSHYLYLTYLLELLKDKTVMLNDPAGIRNANEKLYILNFPDWIPETCVSSTLPVLRGFVKDMGDAVLKPLNERGGIGIVRARRDDADLDKIISGMLSQYGTVMAQKFLPQVQDQGDTRVLVLNGEILGAYARIPPRGDFRVSVLRDGRYEKRVPGDREREIVRHVAPRLLADGLLFVGLDLIGGLISEINVTSPAGIPEINHFAGPNPLIPARSPGLEGPVFAGERLEIKVVDFLEQIALSGRLRLA